MTIHTHLSPRRVRRAIQPQTYLHLPLSSEALRPVFALPNLRLLIMR